MFILIFTSVLGILFLIIGLIIWKKEKITLIHDYHYTKVREEDRKPYTAIMGKGTCLIRIGVILLGIINHFTKTSYGLYAFGIGFTAGMIVICIAQFKYNGGLF